MATKKLEIGKKYDMTTLGVAVGWTDGDDSDDGREVGDWFSTDGTYRGPDCDGVEPLFLDVA